MKPMTKFMYFGFASLALACFMLSQTTWAVVPPPDGGYPGFNTAAGTNALSNLTAGVGNAAVGWYSLFSNTDGSFNTALGAGTLLFNLGQRGQGNGEGSQNTAVGTAALLFNGTGYANSAFGVAALNSNTTGIQNTACGVNALQGNTTGNQNVAVGAGALSNLTGNNNIAIGYLAGSLPTEGDNNIYIGSGGVSVMGLEGNTIRIGSNQQATYVAGISGANIMGQPVVVAADGRVGVTMSSERFKRNIKSMDSASQAVLELKPVTFQYKNDNTGTPQFGLIAEEVARVNPALVLADKEGKPYTVRYEAVNAMLLNEFLKEHKNVEQQARKIQEQDVTIAQLDSTTAKQEAAITLQQKQIEKLIATVTEQAAQIQKVTAQFQSNRPVAQKLAFTGP